MYKQDVIGELLYKGFIVEKGKGSKKKFGFGYKKALKIHVYALAELLYYLYDTNIETNKLIRSFFDMCYNNLRIGKYYSISDERMIQIENNTISWKERDYQYDKVNKLMELLMQELVNEIGNFLLNYNKINKIFRILHNLPRVYIGEGKDSLFDSDRIGISEEDALQFALMNMDEKYKKKYAQYF